MYRFYKRIYIKLKNIYIYILYKMRVYKTPRWRLILRFINIIIIYTYLNELNKLDCNCTKHHRINHLKITLIIHYLLSLLSVNMIIYFLTKEKYMSLKTFLISSIFIILMIVLHIYNIYIIRKYVSYVLNSNCECAKNNKLNIINIINWFDIILVFGGVVFILFTLLYQIYRGWE